MSLISALVQEFLKILIEGGLGGIWLRSRSEIAEHAQLMSGKGQCSLS